MVKYIFVDLESFEVFKELFDDFLTLLLTLNIITFKTHLLFEKKILNLLKNGVLIVVSLVLVILLID